MTASAAISPRLTYRINELATMLGVSVKTLDRMRKDGLFPPPDQHAGRVLLWRVSTVEAWLARDWKVNETKSGSKTRPKTRKPAHTGA
jgi:predicted DNA-binding transcriptional regulator AlpA